MDNFCSKLINNRYKTIRKLGQGGMGIVYLAEDTFKGSLLFAIKTIKHEILSKYQKYGIDTFKNEYEVMTRLKHPNLTRVFDFGSFGNDYFIVLEYLDGTVLSDLIGKKELDSQGCIEIIVQIARALEYIHSRNIVYRDVKPNNIMVMPDRVKMLDFGLSASAKNKEGKIKGTLLYMSPESLKGNVNTRMDIFSLGITFYEMLTCSRFYESENLNSDFILKLLRDSGKFKAYKREKLAGRIRNRSTGSIIDKMMSYDLKDRYLCCSELIADINEKLGMHFEYETYDTKMSYVLGNTFADRKSEFASLTGGISSLKDHVLLIYNGPAGVGKTRLFNEFKKYCRLNDIHYFESNCIDPDISNFHSISEILSQILTFCPLSLLDLYGKYIKLILLDNPRLDIYHRIEIKDNPRLLYEILVENISDFILEFSKDRKTILYFNDIHRMDGGSVYIVQTLMKRAGLISTEDRNLLIYASMNNNQSTENIKDIISHERTRLINLHPLDTQGVHQFIANIFGPLFVDKTLTSSIDRLREKVGGNPFFLEELLKSLIEKNIIIKDKIYWKLLKPVDDIEVPDNIMELIQNKLSKFFADADKRKILKILSLLRIELDLQTLDGIIKRVSDMETPKILLELENMEIIQSVRRENMLFYSYSSSIIKEQIRQSINNKKEISLFLAETLEEISSSNDFAEEIAYQFLEGKSHDKAILYYEKCGDMAASSYINDRALKSYETALDILKNKVSHDTEKEIMISQKMGNILELIGNWQGAREKYRFCLSLSEESGYQNHRADSLRLWGNIERALGNRQEALEMLEKSALMYEETGNDTGKALNANALGTLYFQINQHEKAVMNYQKARNLCSKLGDYKGMGNATGNIGNIYFYTGDYNKALEFYKMHKNTAKETGDKFGIAIANSNMGNIFFQLGDYEKALDCYRKYRNLSEEIGYKKGIAIAIGNMGSAYERMKELRKALKCHKIKKNILEKLGDKQGLATVNLHLGAIYYYMNDYQKALKYFDTAKQISEESGFRRVVASATGNIGLIHQEMGQYSDSIAYHQKHQEISRDIGYKTGEAIANDNLGFAYYHLSDMDRALDHFDKSIKIYTDLNIKNNDLVYSLVYKSKILKEKNRINQAEDISNYALKIAHEIKSNECIFLSEVNSYVVQSVKNRTESILNLHKVLERDLSDEQKADLYSALYFIDSKECYRKEAVNLYRELYRRSPRYIYKKRIRELLLPRQA